MEKRYYTSTNWAPWLGLGFVLSTLFFGFVSNGWLLALCIFLSFLPAIIVALALNSYFLIENNQLKFCYDRKGDNNKVYHEIGLVDITSIQRVGKSIAISFDNSEEMTVRVHEADTFVQDIMQRNPRIELVK